LPIQTWKILLDGENYTIKLHHNSWTNRRVIWLNNVVLENSRTKGLVDVGGLHEFMVGEHLCHLLISQNLITRTYDYQLYIDEKSVDTQKKLNIKAEQLDN